MTTLLTAEQVADRLRVKPATLAQWRWRGQGPEYVKVGSRVRYDEAALDTWLDEQSRGGSRG